MQLCTSGNDVRGGAGKSLARPTSLCRRTESTVSLERGVCFEGKTPQEGNQGGLVLA